MAIRSYTHMSLAAVFMASLVLLGMPRSIRGDVTCDQVYSALLPCRYYLLSSMADPSNSCCNGVSSMVAAGKTTHDRRTICNCIISEAVGYSRAIQNRAAGIPDKCHVSLSFHISPDMNCNTMS